MARSRWATWFGGAHVAAGTARHGLHHAGRIAWDDKTRTTLGRRVANLCGANTAPALSGIDTTLTQTIASIRGTLVLTDTDLMR
jgi:hypothetical protein